MTLELDDPASEVDSEVVSDWVTVDQQMIDQFASATGDFQYIHVDPVRAAKSPFGGTIAHGFLTLSLLVRLNAMAQSSADDSGMDINYGSNKVRFLNPVRAGSRVRGRFKTLETLEKRPGQVQTTTEATIEIEGETKPALICEWITQRLPDPSST